MKDGSGRNWGQFGSLAPHYDELMSGVPYADWVEYVQLLWEVHGCAPQRVLDAACGTGNVSFELARRGYEVVGVDLSRAMIAHAQRKQVELGRTGPQQSLDKRARFVVGDLTNFDLGEKFHAATCLYDSLNYILEPADLGLAFARVGAHVESGGAWAFDMNTPWAFEANLFSQSNRDARRALHYSWEAFFDRGSRVCTVQMRFERSASGGSQVFHETHRERAYEMAEVADLLAASGWDLEKAYDAYTLNAPHKKSERWYFVARKR